MISSASRARPRVLHVPSPSLAIPAVVPEGKLLAANVAVAGCTVVNPVDLIVSVFHRISAGFRPVTSPYPFILRHQHQHSGETSPHSTPSIAC